MSDIIKCYRCGTPVEWPTTGWRCPKCNAHILNAPPNPNPPAGTPTQCRQCQRWFVPNPAMQNVSCCVHHGGGCCHFSDTEVPAPAGTPNAVEEAVQDALGEAWQQGYNENTEWNQEPQRSCLLALIAAVRAECAADYLEKMSQDPESAVAAQMARTQAFADVRRVVEGMPDRYADEFTKGEVLDALAALSAEGK